MLNANFDENIKKGKKLNIFLSIIFMYNFTKFLVRCVVTNSKRMMTMSKEDVRTGVAFAIWTWTSSHLDFWPSELWTSSLWTSDGSKPRPAGYFFRAQARIFEKVPGSPQA